MKYFRPRNYKGKDSKKLRQHKQYDDATPLVNKYLETKAIEHFKDSDRESLVLIISNIAIDLGITTNVAAEIICHQNGDSGVTLHRTDYQI